MTSFSVIIWAIILTGPVGGSPWYLVFLYMRSRAFPVSCTTEQPSQRTGRYPQCCTQILIVPSMWAKKGSLEGNKNVTADYSEYMIMNIIVHLYPKRFWITSNTHGTFKWVNCEVKSFKKEKNIERFWNWENINSMQTAQENCKTCRCKGSKSNVKVKWLMFSDGCLGCHLNSSLTWCP